MGGLRYDRDPDHSCQCLSGGSAIAVYGVNGAVSLDLETGVRLQQW